jgi:hypothetical protein
VSRRPRRIVAFAVVVVVLALGGCGDEGPEMVVPALVPEGLVPATVRNEQLAFYETQVASARDAFANAGPDSLASDGRLWELRIADRLVGVLQLTTLLPDVDLLEQDHRDAIVKQLLPTARDRLDIGDVAVWTSTSSGKSSYLWFGRDMFALLTIKPGSSDAIEPELVLQDVLDHMVASEGWEYVYFDEDEGDGV